MSARVGIKCDGCARELTADGLYLSAGGLRTVLKAHGWHKVRGTYQSVGGERGYSRDLCPNCWKEGKR